MKSRMKVDFETLPEDVKNDFVDIVNADLDAQKQRLDLNCRQLLDLERVEEFRRHAIRFNYITAILNSLICLSLFFIGFSIFMK